MRVHLDFETRSRVDIKKSGVTRYAEDPSTDVICLAWAIDDDEPSLWLPGQPMPSRLHKAVLYEADFWAWNAPFEIAIWQHVMVRRYQWPIIPLYQWQDTAALALTCGYPGQLGKCAKALKVKMQKSVTGTRLINMLSKPKKDGTFRGFADNKDLFLQMYAYCKQDVRTERDIYHALPIKEITPQERRVQLQTWIMNRRGLPIDVVSVDAIQDTIRRYVKHLDQITSLLTDGRLISTRQRDALLEELEVNLPDLQNATVKKALEGELSEKDRKLLEIRKQINHGSIAKFARLQQMICRDGTVKDNIQYHGARTGRDAGRGFQIQNLPRRHVADPDLFMELYSRFGIRKLDLIFPILETASALIRPCVMAPPGKKLIVSDFSQIEARGVAWTTREMDILKEFEAGVDPYIAQASKMYDKPMEEIQKGSIERQYGKMAVLLLGYQGSHKAITRFAEAYKLNIERKEAAEVVKKFRGSRPRLVNAWYSFAQAAMAAVEAPGTQQIVPDCAPAVFQMRGPHLTMRLPSKRLVWYPEARVEEVTVRYEDAETGKMKTFTANAVTCMVIDSMTNYKWVRKGMSGGNLFQNYVQAICRDILMEAVLRCEAAEYPVIGRVHDEVITLVPDSVMYSLVQLNQIMSIRPKWALDFPIKADGYESKRYKKD